MNEQAKALLRARKEEARHGHLPRHDLGRTLSRFSGAACGNPRGKIYGLLGLFADSNFIEVDYNKTVADVFIDAISAVAEYICEIASDAIW